MVSYDPDITELMTVGEFTEAVRDGQFIDYDGSGYYGTGSAYNASCPAIPSEIAKGKSDSKGYAYVHWFSK